MSIFNHSGSNAQFKRKARSIQNGLHAKFQRYIHFIAPSSVKYLSSHNATAVYVKFYYYKIRKYLSKHIALKIILWIAFIILNITAIIMIPYQSIETQIFYAYFGSLFDIATIIVLH